MNELSQMMEDHFIFDYGIMDFDEIPTLIECRAKARLPKQAKSVIVCVFPYYVGTLEHRNLCRYATVVDYHNYINTTLRNICDKLAQLYRKDFQPFVDSSPIPEVFCGVLAGLGFRGKNNLLITKKYGSYVVLGEIVTDMLLPKSAPNQESCLECGLCKKNCPNGAIGSSSIDYARCVSNISQRKGTLTGEEIAAIKRVGFAWGCDQCQDICPHNQLVDKTYLTEFLQDIEPILTLSNIDSLLQTRSYGYKGAKLLKRNLDIINNANSNCKTD